MSLAKSEARDDDDDAAIVVNMVTSRALRLGIRIAQVASMNHTAEIHQYLKFVSDWRVLRLNGLNALWDSAKTPMFTCASCVHLTRVLYIQPRKRTEKNRDIQLICSLESRPSVDSLNAHAAGRLVDSEMVAWRV